MKVALGRVQNKKNEEKERFLKEAKKVNKDISSKIDCIYTEEGKEWLENRKNPDEDKKYIQDVKTRLSTCSNIVRTKICGSCTERQSLIPENSCRLRFCQICAKKSQRLWIKNYCARLLSYARSHTNETPCHITLTIKSPQNLFSGIVELQKYFLKLRRTDVWKHHFSGGFYSLEIEHSSNGWHPHIHILAFRKGWIEQKELSSLWSKITGGSFIVGINKVYSQETEDKEGALVKGIFECVKYLTKSCNLLKLQNKDLLTFILAIKGRNLRDFFGELRGYKITEEEENELSQEFFSFISLDFKDETKCNHCGSSDLRSFLISFQYISNYWRLIDEKFS